MGRFVRRAAVAVRAWRAQSEAAPGQHQGPLVVVVLVSLALLVRLASLIDRYAVDVFHWDQWEFLDGLFHPTSFWQLFRWQHGPHRMGLGLPLMVAVEQLTNWNAVALSYLNAVVMAVAALLAIILKQRVAPPLRWADAVIPVFFLNSSQWAIFVATPDVSHGPLPLLLVMLFVTILATDGLPKRIVALLLVDLVATYTGFGIILGWLTPIVIVFAWWRERLKPNVAGLAFVVASAILASFFYDYRVPWHRGLSCLNVGAGPTYEYLSFFVLLFGRALGATRIVSIPTLLGGAAAALIFWLIVVRSMQLLKPAHPDDHIPDVTWVLAAFTLAFAAVASLGRACQGAQLGLNSRYVPYMLPGLLALYLSWVSMPSNAAKSAKGALGCGLLVAYVCLDVWPRSRDVDEMQYYHVGKERWAQCFRSKRDALACTKEARFEIYADASSPDFTAKLAVLEKRHLGLFARH
jgi:hypothetical protein